VADGIVRDLRVAGQGCSISQSSASMMSAAVKGQPLDEARRLIRTFKAMMSVHEVALGEDGAGGSGDPGDGKAPEPLDPSALGELAALQGVVKFPVRIKCATLSWNTLSQGLDEIEEGLTAQR
jgi:nitrogen fixation NifU-like protein